MDKEFLNGLIDRLKKVANVETDTALSGWLDRRDNYISLCRTRQSIDLDLILSKCYSEDLNWLLKDGGLTQKPTLPTNGDVTTPSKNQNEEIIRLRAELASYKEMFRDFRKEFWEKLTSIIEASDNKNNHQTSDL